MVRSVSAKPWRAMQVLPRPTGYSARRTSSSRTRAGGSRGLRLELKVDEGASRVGREQPGEQEAAGERRPEHGRRQEAHEPRHVGERANQVRHEDDAEE